MDLPTLLTGPVEEVAPRLLGAVLRKGAVAAYVTEVEAYAGADDPASHAARGETPRNGVMFGPPGRLYTYLSHGIHVCANVSVGPAGSPAAVLLRAATVEEGLDLVRTRRGAKVPDRDLARGPGRLCRALDIALADDGTDLVRGGVQLHLATAPPPAEVGPRVGVRRAADRPWRFWIDGAPVSRHRRHPRAEPEW